MRMKMNTSLCGPDVNVAPGGVHTCSPAEAIRHYRAGHATPTGECAEEFAAALAEQDAIEAAEHTALDADKGDEEDGKDQALPPANDPAIPASVPAQVIIAQQPGQIASAIAAAASTVTSTPAAKPAKTMKAKA